ncbi:MAG: F0F1 ATP synthase subunit gamma [Alphaproteobacteria bacterium]
MAGLKELRNRIASVKATRKITKAKQMVAASKLRRAQEAAVAARPYAEAMEHVIANLAAAFKDNPGAPMLLNGTGRDETHLVIIATADRGLCGAFNSSIARAAREHIEEVLKGGKTVKILHVGRKGFDILKRYYRDRVLETIDMRAVRKLSFVDAERIATKVLDLFQAGGFDVAWLFYSKFVNVVTQRPTKAKLIPVDVPEVAAVAGKEGRASYEYEPDEEAILRAILPRGVAIQIFRALLENAAGEQGASMTAMDNATRNAGDIIDKYTLKYNRARQAQITKELIEIISGAEAL